MSSLTRFENDGIELVIDEITGEAYATQSGYASMAEKNKSTISRRCETVAENVIKKAELLTSTGLKTVALIPADLVFDWLWDDNPTLAKRMGKAGATLYLYQIAGYSLKPEKKVEPKLPPTSIERIEKVQQLKDCIEFFNIDFENPRFKQSIQDIVLDTLNVTPDKALEGSQEIWLGVAERAEQLGYSVALVAKHRSTLGKWVKKADLPSTSEKRLCNGTQREINLYLQTEELDANIHSFFEDLEKRLAEKQERLKLKEERRLLRESRKQQ